MCLMLGRRAPSLGAPRVAGPRCGGDRRAQARPEGHHLKKRRRHNSRRRNGHRQDATLVRITRFLTDGAKPSARRAASERSARRKAERPKPHRKQPPNRRRSKISRRFTMAHKKAGGSSRTVAIRGPAPRRQEVAARRSCRQHHRAPARHQVARRRQCRLGRPHDLRAGEGRVSFKTKDGGRSYVVRPSRRRSLAE